MRIATWNLERGGRTARARTAQEQILATIGADVIVLTEPPASYANRAGVVTSPLQRVASRGHEPWVAIVGSGVSAVDVDVPYDRLAVAARCVVADRSFIIYGTVLPWLAVTSHAPELVRAGESSFDAFKRVLGEQVIDVEGLQRRYPEPVIWAGDFNQTVAGPNLGGSAERRALLNDALAELGCVAWNATAAHASAGMYAIDLICGPRDHEPVRQGRIDPALDGVAASDHAGYWIEF
jgi:endonuclease/exonuclease/phosphatase family metal-dependent hydrolase